MPSGIHEAVQIVSGAGGILADPGGMRCALPLRLTFDLLRFWSPTILFLLSTGWNLSSHSGWPEFA